MTDKLLIERELLERLAAPLPGDNGWQTWHTQKMIEASKELRTLLDAPRQPEGDAEAQLNEWAKDKFSSTGRYKGRVYGNTDWALARAIHTDLLASHERAIAELREQNYALAAEAVAKGEEIERLRLKVTLFNDGKPYAALKAERDTLRQQLAERDAEIERLRGRLEKAWLEGDRVATQGWELQQAIAQRDKMAGLLRRAAGFTTADGSLLYEEIKAALAEVNK